MRIPAERDVVADRGQQPGQSVEPGPAQVYDDTHFDDAVDEAKQLMRIRRGLAAAAPSGGASGR